MFSRFEDKILVNKNKKLLLLNWIKDNSGKQLYPQRKITSIYYDNSILQTYHDSNEGIVPRKKIRIRYYNEKKNELFIEKKINSAEGKYKFVNKAKERKIRVITDNMYGICLPKIKVQYIRNYFRVLNKRITIDNQITYLSLKNYFKIRDESLMLEIKYKDKEDNKIFTKLADQTIRFSKYCRGIEFLNLL